MTVSDSESFGHALIDEAIVRTMVPWACPSDFGPNGRYRLEELIGVGRVSLVYRAVDTHLSSDSFEAEVAIKIVSTPGAQRQEALNARRVRHPNVVQIIDRGITEDDVSYIVEELVDGNTLADGTMPWPARDAARFMVKVARGVQAVHSAGIVHCDLKPANVLINEQGEPKVADFGLAVSGGEGEACGGNLAFMSPEQYLDPDTGIAPPADIYALGGLLHYLITGLAPNGETHDQVSAKLKAGDVPARLEVDRDLDLVCRKALATVPGDRHHSAGAFADDLESWLAWEPVRWTRPPMRRRLRLWFRRNRLFAIAAALALVFILVWAVAYVQSQQKAINDVNEKMRRHIRELSPLLMQAPAADVQVTYLPALVWLEWLTSTPILEPVRDTVNETRIDFLRTMSDRYQQEGERGHIDALLTDYSLAHFLLLEGRWSEAMEVLDRCDQTTVERLAKDDPIVLSLEAMRVCARAMADSAAGADRQALLARLQDEDDALRTAGNCETARKLLEAVHHHIENN